MRSQNNVDPTFESLTNVRVISTNPLVAISMNYRMAPSDADPRDPIFVYDFNKRVGEAFRVYYSLAAPQTVAPCHDTRADIGGWVCR